MTAAKPFRKLPFHLALVVLVAGLASLRLHYASNISVAHALIVWIGTVIFGGLIAVATTFVVAELDKREKESYRTDQKKAQ